MRAERTSVRSALFFFFLPLESEMGFQESQDTWTTLCTSRTRVLFFANEDDDDCTKFTRLMRKRIWICLSHLNLSALGQTHTHTHTHNKRVFPVLHDEFTIGKEGKM